MLIAADHPVDIADEAPLAPTLSLSDALSEVSGRTDVRAIDRRAKAADRVYHDRWADYLPYLTAAIQGFYQNPPTTTLPLWGYQALFTLTIPFYDGGSRYGTAQEHAAQAKEGHANLEALLRQATSEVRVTLSKSRHR